jgi:glycerate dehydrogenase
MKIVFLDEYSIGGADISAIKALGDYTGYDITHRNQILERSKGAEIIIVNKTILDADTIAALPDLRLICVAATGMNNVDLEAAAAHGVEVRNAVGYSTYSVAETTIGSAIALLREVVYYDEYFKSGRYAASDYLFNYDRPTSQVRGKKWGIIGLGNIGRKVAAISEVFGMKVCYFSTSGTGHCKDYPCLSLEELLAQSDIVSIHAPLNERTNGLIGRAELARMKPSAILVNMGRGAIVDEAALAEAVDAGVIAGAGMDVFVVEPIPEDHPYLKMQHPERMSLAPHVAWGSVEARTRLVGMIADNIKLGW